MIIEVPSQIENTFSGYQHISEMFDKTQNEEFGDIVFDFIDCRWFDANLLAAFGALIDNLESNFNNINIRNLDIRVESIFKKNGFYSIIKGARSIDHWGTTIKYQKFKTVDEILFSKYLDSELFTKKSMPKMSSGLNKRIKENIFEIFNNAIIHSGCEYIYTCGQYFHKRERIDLSIVDIGKTIRYNVKEFLNKNISGIDAIQWATEESNTTRIGEIPGGLGLKLLREFLKMNKGKLQIISDNGFWEENDEGIIEKRETNTCFPGTIVNIEINTGDEEEYKLSNE